MADSQPHDGEGTGTLENKETQNVRTAQSMRRKEKERRDVCTFLKNLDEKAGLQRHVYMAHSRSTALRVECSLICWGILSVS